MKFKRTERIGAIVKILSDNPNKIYTLSFFTEKFNSSKSTISEDLLVVKEIRTMNSNYYFRSSWRS